MAWEGSAPEEKKSQWEGEAPVVPVVAKWEGEAPTDTKQPWEGKLTPEEYSLMPQTTTGRFMGGVGAAVQRVKDVFTNPQVAKDTLVDIADTVAHGFGSIFGAGDKELSTMLGRVPAVSPEQLKELGAEPTLLNPPESKAVEIEQWPGEIVGASAPWAKLSSATSAGIHMLGNKVNSILGKIGIDIASNEAKQLIPTTAKAIGQLATDIAAKIGIQGITGFEYGALSQQGGAEERLAAGVETGVGGAEFGAGFEAFSAAMKLPRLARIRYLNTIKNSVADILYDNGEGKWTREEARTIADKGIRMEYEKATVAAGGTEPGVSDVRRAAQRVKAKARGGLEDIADRGTRVEEPTITPETQADIAGLEQATQNRLDVEGREDLRQGLEDSKRQKRIQNTIEGRSLEPTPYVWEGMVPADEQNITFPCTLR